VIFIHPKETKMFYPNIPTDATPYDSNTAQVFPELELLIL